MPATVHSFSQSFKHSRTILPPYLWANAGLALTAAVHASPLAKEGLPAEDTTTAVDQATTFYMPGKPAAAPAPTKVNTDSATKVTTDKPTGSPVETFGPGSSSTYNNTATLSRPNTNLPQATEICRHGARDPKTWKDSGAALYVEEYLIHNKFSMDTTPCRNYLQKASTDLQTSGC